MTREQTIRMLKEQYLYERCNRVLCEDCVLNDSIHEWEKTGSSDELNCLNFSKSDEDDLDKAIKWILDTTEFEGEVRTIDELYKAIKQVQESKDLDKAHNINKLADNVTKLNNSLKDNVNHPSHYNDGKIEVIEFIEDKKLGFCLGNAIKYIARAGKKDKSKEAEDIKKAIWYLNRYLKQLGECAE